MSDTPRRAGEKWDLRLYTAGQSPKSLAALDNLKRICEQHLAGRHSIEVIDLLKNPRRAQDDQVVAIPTRVRRLPQPSHKIVGDLSSAEALPEPLEEAQDVRRAITRGEVDAFVVGPG